MTSSDDPCSMPDIALRVAVVVAHPDDETLWAGGLLLSRPNWSPFILSMCRAEDPDRAPRFLKAVACLGAEGAMGNLDDGPDQFPLSTNFVKAAILALLPRRDFDLLLTHAPQGEYTWHRRHGEVSKAVTELWQEGDIRVRSVGQFAYEDGGGTHAPRPQPGATFRIALPDPVWARKSGIISDIYGFEADTWEAKAVSQEEAFNCFSEPGSIHPLAEKRRAPIR